MRDRKCHSASTPQRLSAIRRLTSAFPGRLTVCYRKMYYIVHLSSRLPHGPPCRYKKGRWESLIPSQAEDTWKKYLENLVTVDSAFLRFFVMVRMRNTHRLSYMNPVPGRFGLPTMGNTSNLMKYLRYSREISTSIRMT
jgi:hypothetical protein